MDATGWSVWVRAGAEAEKSRAGEKQAHARQRGGYLLPPPGARIKEQLAGPLVGWVGGQREEGHAG